MMQPTLEMRDLIGDDAEEAQMWMRDFKKCMLVHTLTLTAARLPEAHARAFPLHVAPGSEAAQWWTGLTPAQQNSWTNIQLEFDTRWPPVQARAVPVTEHIDAFYAHIFETSQLDTRIPTGNGNATRNAHTVFAEKLKTLGLKSTLPHVALIRAASKQVPPAMEELMQAHAQLPWDRWCEELGRLDVAVIQSRQRLFDRLDAIESRQNTPSPAYTQPYQQPRQQQQQQYQPQPVQQQTTPQSWRAPVPGSPVPFDTPPPPRNSATIARVEQERREWAARWPDGRALASRHYPLTPGTAHAVAGCTRCGEAETPSHTRYSCVSANPLPELEQKYRANVRVTAAKMQQPRAMPMTPGALGSPRGFSTPQRGGNQWSGQRGLFAQRGSWNARGGFPTTPGTPSPLHQLEQEEEVDEEVELEFDEGSAGNGEETA